jgi:CBS domain-containing protein|tara:strand:- start:46 stop:447 length:402 start_codon:yes stop_codon:yes gene_type:complete
MLLSVDLRDYMLTNPIKIKADENLLDAMGLIIDNKVSGVCVVDTQGMLVGVLSEMDCLNAVLDATYNEGSIGCVQDYMTRDHILSAKPSDDIIDIAQDMLVHKHRRRPVVENGKLVGQITCRQLLSAVKKFNR